MLLNFPFSLIDPRRRRWWAGSHKEKLQSSCQDTISFFRVHTPSSFWLKSRSYSGVYEWGRQVKLVASRWIYSLSWRFSRENMSVGRGGPFVCSQEMLEITQSFVANSFVPETILGGETITVNTTGKKILPLLQLYSCGESRWEIVESGNIRYWELKRNRGLNFE